MDTLLGSVRREITRARPAWPRTRQGPPTAPPLTPRYPGDFRGTVEIVYAPHPNGAPDPGEIVWAAVPFEEDHSRGKDRPVLLVGHEGD